MVVKLQTNGFQVIIIDDLSNSSLDVLNGIYAITGVKPIFEKIDLKDKKLVIDFFKRYSDIDGVIHFAASKVVGESINDPLKYYENNISSLVYVLKELQGLQLPKFIFSSSCTVYSQAGQLPLTENISVKEAESPYGNTKKIGEQIIKDLCNCNNSFNAISLRYFNPIGAHPSGKNWGTSDWCPHKTWYPNLIQTAIGIRKEFFIFGKDYPTPDGTCIRNYIHVVDLASAHVVAL